jgi:DNA mismatch repair protein MutL
MEGRAAEERWAGPPRIHLLDKAVAEKIAAGEVIERPASVVKELVENAVDACALHVSIELENAGKKLIRVTDDGVGIHPQDMKLALLSHATSKLASDEDLLAIDTLGFRGEALSSVAAISHLDLASCLRGQPGMGMHIRAEGGVVGEPTPAGLAEGTTVEVRDLFFNVPARLKFLKAESTEWGHVTEAVTRVALAHPEVHFVLTHNRRKCLDLPAGADVVSRIGGLFSPELASACLRVRQEETYFALEAYLAPPDFARASARMQHIFINGRWVDDRLLRHVLGELYEGVLPARRQPVAFLFLRLPAGEVDVNVHPAKLHIRFRRPDRVYSLVRSLLGQALRQAPWEVTLPLVSAAPGPGPGGPEAPSPRERIRQAVSDFLSKRREGSPVGLLPEPAVALPANRVQPSPRQSAGPRAAMQVHGSYIVEETPEGLRIIDQHALHERILYEALKARLAAAQVESQHLLVPRVLEVTRPEMTRFEEHRDLFAQAGLVVRPFGPTALAVYAYPALLAPVDPEELVRGVLGDLEEVGRVREPQAQLEEFLQRLACRGAVKAGTVLSPEALATLLAERGHLDHEYRCPHGRPTALVFTLEELERRFGRR